jgi:hypothetical protein
VGKIDLRENANIHKADQKVPEFLLFLKFVQKCQKRNYFVCIASIEHCPLA